ncbi:hypothetical protein TV39_19045 [Arthrobacter sp. SPG23]|uniref:DUF6286 domain-containing protein n=1 Tax=Arthrobacter sp. SPG23 TaxID=1610703 RepID=UPI0005B7D25F|nr:DUF6286 domain-containing protein [Arthrobacter sp. SPG23]KIS26098.1 hypothetical protein TV39_19045 [Arthrobacter sp. SPG23]
MSGKLHISRTVRRELHSSRAAASAATATAAAGLLLWLALETALSAAGQQPLIVRPLDAGRWLAGTADSAAPSLLTAAGAGLGLAGLLFLVLAVAPGRRPRHALGSARAAIVADHEVIAAAISRAARRQAGVAPGQVSTTVGTRTVNVTVHPTSGIPVDADAVKAAVDVELGTYALPRRMRSSIRVSTKGVVGQ